MSELEILKHKGDRNYLEFTLQKGAKPTLLSTVKLQLKKADEKHSRYTLECELRTIATSRRRTRGWMSRCSSTTARTPCCMRWW